MTQIAQIIMYLWPVIVVGIYASYTSTRKAMIASFVFAWLALPILGFQLPGLPDYTKMLATVMAVFVCMCLFDQAKIAALRFRWFDLAPLVWWLGPFVTALTNDLGVYEATASIVDGAFNWGLPYFIGRVYLTDPESIRELALAIAVGGLCYVPLCLFEIRFSPMLAQWIYGYTRWDGVRYGGYRPKVFLTHGLELGIWMSNATLICYMLWASGSVRTIRGFSTGKLTLALSATTLLCKSTGALLLLVFGGGVLWLARRTGKTWVVWLVIAIPPAYALSRGSSLWSARNLVEATDSLFGAERAESIQYRIDMEDKLIARFSERPILGWGRFGRNHVTNARGQSITVADGYWIIALGTQGVVGLGCLLVMFLLPLATMIRRFPISTWSDPQVGPLVAISIVLALTMIDFLSNAMLNPIYPLAIGGIFNQKSFRSGRHHDAASEALEMGSMLAAEGRPPEAELEFRRAVEHAMEQDDEEARAIHARALDGLGQTWLATGRAREAEAALREALILRDRLAAGSADPDRFRDLAIAREGLGRALAEIGRVDEAVEERRIALQVWDRLVADHPRVLDYRTHLAAGLNDLAWLLATDPSTHDPAQALGLAEESARVSGDPDGSANTLGVARYRAGDWAGAIEALERSALSSPGGQGTSFDHYFLSMAWCRLHREDQAQEWLERGIAWEARHRPGHAALGRFRREAESVSGRGPWAVRSTTSPESRVTLWLRPRIDAAHNGKIGRQGDRSCSDRARGNSVFRLPET